MKQKGAVRKMSVTEHKREAKERLYVKVITNRDILFLHTIL
ncbi:hypothetical protein CGLO_17771 [Colletotrichum gloeosporioides Cg-14]|uniref:Uncharacterized protein n=1 Tax=Colletotrichum gloeosporioides (strain Cg-14) TaxID=1237896 RepID=T0L5L4_COLGC|nr:hypothetical protein CGLO_17771 [Colletotrichum gloeosporioides Cg-14]